MPVNLSLKTNSFSNLHKLPNPQLLKTACQRLSQEEWRFPRCLDDKYKFTVVSRYKPVAISNSRTPGYIMCNCEMCCTKCNTLQEFPLHDHETGRVSYTAELHSFTSARGVPLFHLLPSRNVPVKSNMKPWYLELFVESVGLYICIGLCTRHNQTVSSRFWKLAFTEGTEGKDVSLWQNWCHRTTLLLHFEITTYPGFRSPM
jgi:hypothetical protein